MRSKMIFAVTACVLLAAGCGSSSKNSSSSSTTKTSSDPAVAAKETQVSRLKADLAKHPDDPARMANLANAYVALASPNSGDTKMPAGSDGNYANALKLLEQAHQAKPSDASISQNLVDAYLHAHKYPEAQALLQTLVTIKGANANTFYQLALAAQNAGNFQTAIGAWNEFIAKSPKSEPRIASVKTFIKGDQAALKQQSTTPQTQTGAGAGKPDTKNSTTSVSTTSSSTSTTSK